MQSRIWPGVLAASLITNAAGADLPPPDGMKRVSYAFQVNGLRGFGDWVLLGFPMRAPAGNATHGFTPIEDGKRTRVDRRNGTPKLYATKKHAYEAWLAKYQPAADPNRDPALDALFASAQVVACNLSPRPLNIIRKDDPRSEIVETFRVKALTSTNCELELTSGTPPTADPSAAPTGAPPASAAPATSPTNSPSAAPPSAKPGGCGGCTLSTQGESGGSALALWLGALGLLRRARRR